jgi:predicted kinase
MLHIIRGLPGSGKTTFAKTLGCFHVETDMFFVQNGVYVYDPKKIAAAHQWCKNTVMQAMRTGMGDVAVSNTFTQIWEMEPYIDMCIESSRFKVYHCYGKWNNIHGVPTDVLQKMEERWEVYPNEIPINKE